MSHFPTIFYQIGMFYQNIVAVVIQIQIKTRIIIHFKLFKATICEQWYAKVETRNIHDEDREISLPNQKHTTAVASDAPRALNTRCSSNQVQCGKVVASNTAVKGTIRCSFKLEPIVVKCNQVQTRASCHSWWGFVVVRIHLPPTLVSVLDHPVICYFSVSHETTNFQGS